MKEPILVVPLEKGFSESARKAALEARRAKMKAKAEGKSGHETAGTGGKEGLILREELDAKQKVISKLQQYMKDGKLNDSWKYVLYQGAHTITSRVKQAAPHLLEDKEFADVLKDYRSKERARHGVENRMAGSASKARTLRKE